ncbi:nuclear transport factor 2 family protein [Pontibacter ruber]|uniref:Nuclear transport factor 2 family protein n=1 Tax=Pontibacter ruber TaxID=1343895 RepID=A0ABW5CV55_9BACT|nr:nuclear transport factor 2 family protein [Pontibacter ruber]
MENSEIRTIIERYTEAYNSFDVEGMMEYMHPEIVFENISDGEATLTLNGTDSFRAQAQEAAGYFSERQQRITNLEVQGDKAVVEVDYAAVLAIDLPNGLKAGDKLELQGKSVFTFKDGKIIRLQDFS